MTWRATYAVGRLTGAAIPESVARAAGIVRLEELSDGRSPVDTRFSARRGDHRGRGALARGRLRCRQARRRVDGDTAVSRRGRGGPGSPADPEHAAARVAAVHDRPREHRPGQPADPRRRPDRAVHDRRDLLRRSAPSPRRSCSTRAATSSRRTPRASRSSTRSTTTGTSRRSRSSRSARTTRSAAPPSRRAPRSRSASSTSSSSARRARRRSSSRARTSSATARCRGWRRAGATPTTSRRRCRSST